MGVRLRTAQLIHGLGSLIEEKETSQDKCNPGNEAPPPAGCQRAIGDQSSEHVVMCHAGSMRQAVAHSRICNPTSRLPASVA